MLINLLINVILIAFSYIFQILPTVHLPSFMSDPLAFAVGAYNSFTVTLPYAKVVFTVMLYLLTFEFSMLVAKFILGSRLPKIE